MTYIATFFSHFGAIRFKRYCDGRGIPAHAMPVPRALSSSCGTCVHYEGEYIPPEGDETEQVVRVEEGGYAPVYRAE